MQHKFVRADNSVIQNIKSVRYISQANEGSNLRWGSTISDCVEVTVYGSISDAPADGEVITYYKVFDVNKDMQPLSAGVTRELLVGQFTVTPAVPSKNTYSFVAYDNIRKLDVDFSVRLKQLESSFPMTMFTLLQEAATVSGVTLSYTGIVPWYSNAKLNYFYSDGITCRDIFSALAELNAGYVYCQTNGSVSVWGQYAANAWGGNDAWRSSDSYIICPTDQQTYTNQWGVALHPVVYKENGMSFSNFVAEPVGEVILRKSDGTVVYDYTPQSPAGSDIYEISNNILLDNIPATDYDVGFPRQTLCSSIETTTNSAIGATAWDGKMRNSEVHIFPFLNPYKVGLMTKAISSDGTRWLFPVMKMVESDTETVLYTLTTGTMYRSTQKYQTADQTNMTLSARVDQNSEKVEGLETDKLNVSDVDSSVEGSLQSNQANCLAALGMNKQTLSPTVVSTLPSGASSVTITKCERAGYVVCLTVNVTISSSPSSTWQNIATGLPAPSAHAIFEIDTNDATWGRKARFRVNSSTGALQLARGTASQSYEGTFTYLADSL